MLSLQYFCLVYSTSGDSSKNWEVWEFQKIKQLRQSMSTFGFLFYVTYQCLHHRLRLEASAVEECFDAALFFCCKKKKNISGDRIRSGNKLRNIIKKTKSNKKSTSHVGYFVLQLGDTAVQRLIPRKTTRTCLSATACGTDTQPAETGSQLCSSSGEEIKHICLPCLLTADKTRNSSQKNWNMNCLGVGYSHFFFGTVLKQQ